MDTAGVISGMLFSFSLIVAIGAQNAYVLQQGVRRQHVGSVVAICAASDVALIAAGVAGIGTLATADPSVLTVIRVVGAALLLAYAGFAARRALSRADGSARGSAGDTSRARAVVATLAFTWLNPAVYLDTLVLLGSVANAHPGSRWWFAAGAATASVTWFVGLGYGARLLTSLLTRPSATRYLDGFVAAVMTLTALRTIPH